MTKHNLKLLMLGNILAMSGFNSGISQKEDTPTKHFDEDRYNEISNLKLQRAALRRELKIEKRKPRIDRNLEMMEKLNESISMLDYKLSELYK